MFALHDRVRRRICIAGFFALAVAPTLAVLGLALAWRLPSHVRAEAERLGRQLGMDVSLTGVEHPLPGVIRYRGLDLSSPETGRTLLRCGRLEAQTRMRADDQGRPRPTLLLSVWRPEVEVAEMAEVGQLLARATRLGLGNSRCDAQLKVVDQTQLLSGDTPRTLTGVEGILQTTAGGTQAVLRFRLADNETGDPVKIRLGRNRQIEPAADWFEIDTGGGALPCDLLGLAIAPMRSLGANAQFHGYLCAMLVADGWEGRISDGQFSDVELDRLVTDRFARQLSGPAHVVIEQAWFRGGRVESIRGIVSAGSGEVSRSLLEAAAAELGLGAGPPQAGPDTIIPYGELAFRFTVDGSGLTLDGLCRTRPGAVMCDARGQLLGSLHRPRPFAALCAPWPPAPRSKFPSRPKPSGSPAACRLPDSRKPAFQTRNASGT